MHCTKISAEFEFQGHRPFFFGGGLRLPPKCGKSITSQNVKEETGGRGP